MLKIIQFFLGKLTKFSKNSVLLLFMAFLYSLLFLLLAKSPGTLCTQFKTGQSSVTVCTNPPVTNFEVHFDKGSSEIPLSELPKILEIAHLLREHPRLTVLLIGHTDKTPGIGIKSHRSLSKARAESVRLQLQEYGIASNRIITEGIGNTRPVHSNDGFEDEDESRRVEITIR